MPLTLELPQLIRGKLTGVYEKCFVPTFGITCPGSRVVDRTSIKLQFSQELLQPQPPTEVGNHLCNHLDPKNVRIAVILTR